MIRALAEIEHQLTPVASRSLWIQHDWIDERFSSHEKILLEFPCLNTLSAQLILNHFSIRELAHVDAHALSDHCASVPLHAREDLMAVLDKPIVLQAGRQPVGDSRADHNAGRRPPGPSPSDDSYHGRRADSLPRHGERSQQSILTSVSQPTDTSMMFDHHSFDVASDEHLSQASYLDHKSRRPQTLLTPEDVSYSVITERERAGFQRAPPANRKRARALMDDDQESTSRHAKLLTYELLDRDKGSGQTRLRFNGAVPKCATALWPISDSRGAVPKKRHQRR